MADVQLTDALPIITGFAQDLDTTTGLTFGIKAGQAVPTSPFAAGTVTLTDDASNFLYLCPFIGDGSIEQAVLVDDGSGSVYVPQSSCILFGVTTVGGEITAVTDYRPQLYPALALPAYLAYQWNTDLGYLQTASDGEGGFVTALLSGHILTTAGRIPCSGQTAITVSDDATNYIEIASNGAVTANQSAFTSGRMPLCEVVLADGKVTSVTDHRGFMTFVPII